MNSRKGKNDNGGFLLPYRSLGTMKDDVTMAEILEENNFDQTLDESLLDF